MVDFHKSADNYILSCLINNIRQSCRQDECYSSFPFRANIKKRLLLLCLEDRECICNIAVTVRADGYN